jgi:adenylate cyclase
MSNQNFQWEQEKQELLSELEDMKLLYETVAEHSSLIENELETKNKEISALIEQMKKYLSPQLFQFLMGSKQEVSHTYKRKFLSIFFSDIIGFTEISDRVDPEVLSEILNGYLDDMAQIAHKHGGTIDKFIGDALMIFFGDPEYINDQRHAKDCCAMAIEMQEKIRLIDDVWRKKGVPQGLKVRMGVHSGYCTVGNFGSQNRMDYTIIGGNVNLASRLESIAQSGSIFISSVTKNLLPSDFDAKFVQELKMKGIHYPVEVFELCGYNSREDSVTLDKNPYLEQTPQGFKIKDFITYQELEDPISRRWMQQAFQMVVRWQKEE